MLRIGILGGGFVQWGGGLDFLRTICASLGATSIPMELHFLLPVSGPRATFQAVMQTLKAGVYAAAGKQATSYAPSAYDIEHAIAGYDVSIICHRIDLGDRAVAKIFRRLGLHILLPSFKPLPFGTEVPWLGYLYDFQHRHLPHFFSQRERTARDNAFATMLKVAPGVIVNANVVASDIAQFYPEANAMVFALPFSTAPSPGWLDLDSSMAQQKYGIPTNYFIVCNQFWQHKDHTTAFTAFTAFSQRHPEVHLVCTGAISDHRSIDYFKGLMQQIERDGVSNRIHILGLIPKNDQIALLRGAIGLLQPTLSEGGPGGGAVYDSVALGIPSIVSDIPVNREIHGEESVSFFRAKDSVSLAAGMTYLMQGRTGKQYSSNELLRQGLARRARCGNMLLDAIAQVCPRHNV
jgi:glycosyltransferase involved in cell wall biosynthesis